MGCEGRTALVTGAAGSGMGRSIALTLARDGARVVVNYRTSREMAEAVVDHIREGGGEAAAAQADVFEAEDCRRLVKEAKAAFGQVDICIIGPGAGWHAEPPQELDADSALADVWQELAPLYNLMPLVLPGMYKRKWGRVIGLALHPTELPPAYAYNAAKAARTGALRLLAKEAWPRGVAVNAICPGPVEGLGTLDEAVELCDHGAAWRKRKAVTPQDVAEGVAFLCSDSGRYVAGSAVPYFAG